ncbi:M16 family metallopeptidase [Marinilabilia rubra]|uniref:Peptidase M16 n=1 Tax=Marinilabilia rubra TaxID=2162893 RepID=A0A2U2B9F3_9BACT|nr:pitrilysin family protein [Marinilabilia rubra]PWD99674.1 peptidase M16 [Marinilabilia rubra]
MKRILSIAVLFALVTAASAQLDRSTPPVPGPAPEVQIGDYDKFTLPNGLTVIVVENDKVPVVSYSLTLDVDLPREGKNAGYISMAGNLLRAGTTNRTKSEIDEEVDFIGGTLSTHAKGIYGRSLTKHSEELLTLMSDVLLNPTFPQEELDKQVKQNKTGIQANKEEPRAIAGNVAGKLVYGKDDPYGEITTEETLDNITPQLCRSYYQKYFRPNAAYLVVVGDISKKEAKKQAKKYFGDWEEAPVPQNMFPFPGGYDEPQVVIANKEGANQSTIMVTHEVMLPPGHPDMAKAKIMNEILGGGSFNARLFQNLREDKAYTYGAYSSLSPDERVGRFSASAQVRTSVTDSALTEVLKEMETLQTELVDEEELQLVKNVLIGDFGRALEDPQTVARFALNIERYDLPQDYYENYLKRVEAVTREDVKAAAEKYLKPEKSVILAVGNASAIEDKMKLFSPSQTVTQYDYYGNIVEKKAVAANISPMDVIDDYIRAIGGKETIRSVNDLKMTMGMQVQGMPLEVNVYQKKPNKFYQATSMQGNVVSMQVFDGEKGKVKTPMGEQELQGEMLAQLKENAKIFPELDFNADGIELKLDGVEQVNGKDAYKIMVTKPSGLTTTMFFGVEDGLKCKEVSQSPQGTVSTTINDYQTVEGIKFPKAMTQVMGPQSFDIDIKTIEINAGVEDSQFSIN